MTDPLPGGGDLPPFPPSSEPVVDDGFSTMFYEKGASINRMVATHVGWEAWDNGLGRQLNAHLWQNPTVEDLMRSLDPAFAAVGSPSAIDAMLPWLRRPGFPVVTLSISTSTLHATQTPVSKYLPVLAPSEPKAWWIPLRVQVPGAARTMLFEFNTSSAAMPVPKGPAPALASDRQALVGDPSFLGFFIVRYDTAEAWSARISVAVADLEARPDYTRMLVLHTTLLVQLSHDKVAVLAELITALSPAMAANPTIGGFNGAGDLYRLIITRSAPLLAVTVAAGVDDDLLVALRGMVGPLIKTLGWAPGGQSCTATGDECGKSDPNAGKCCKADICRTPHYCGGPAPPVDRKSTCWPAPPAPPPGCGSVGATCTGTGVGDCCPDNFCHSVICRNSTCFQLPPPPIPKLGGVVSADDRTPWPQKEDRGVDRRGRDALRPTALFAAIQYGDQGIINAGLALFRSSGKVGVTGPGRRAAYFATARHGTAADVASLQAMLVASLKNRSSTTADLLFGLSAGATSANCAAGLDAVKAAARTPADVVAALTDVLANAPDCRAVALDQFTAAAVQLWRVAGDDGTSAVTAGLASLSTAHELVQATRLFVGSPASPHAVHAALTKIKINMDFVARKVSIQGA